jgi:hypothetical protein
MPDAYGEVHGGERSRRWVLAAAVWVVVGRGEDKVVEGEEQADGGAASS